MFIFLDRVFSVSFFRGFRTHILATTVCTTGVYTHSFVARTIPSTARSLHTHAWPKAQGHQKDSFIAHVSYLSISPSSFSCFTCLCCSCTFISRPTPTTTSLTPTSTSSCRPGAGHGPLRTCIVQFVYLAKSDANTISEDHATVFA